MNIILLDQNIPAWVAPEVHLSNAPTTASDVYSFGILLWCLMTRRTPFEGISGRKIAKAVLSKKARPEYSFQELTQLPFQHEYMMLMTSCWETRPASRPSMGNAFGQMNSFCHTMKTLRTLTRTWRQKSSRNVLDVSDKDTGGVEKRPPGAASNQAVVPDTVKQYDPFEGAAEVEMTSVKSPE